MKQAFCGIQTAQCTNACQLICICILKILSVWSPHLLELKYIHPIFEAIIHFIIILFRQVFLCLFQLGINVNFDYLYSNALYEKSQSVNIRLVEVSFGIIWSSAIRGLHNLSYSICQSIYPCLWREYSLPRVTHVAKHSSLASPIQPSSTSAAVARRQAIASFPKQLRNSKNSAVAQKADNDTFSSRRLTIWIAPKRCGPCSLMASGSFPTFCRLQIVRISISYIYPNLHTLSSSWERQWP